jgi:Glucodextranase, domain B/FecR protein
MKMGKRMVVVDWHTIPIRYIQIAFLIIIIVAAFLVYYLYFKPSAGQGQETPTPMVGESTASFVTISGDVQVKKADLYVWKPADYRVDLQEGDLIRTAPDAHARIKFNDGTVVDISSDTMIRVEKEKTVEQEKQIVTNIDYGQVDVNVPGEKKDDSIVRSGPMKGTLKPGTDSTVKSNPAQNTRSLAVSKGIVDVQVGNEKMHLESLEEARIEKEKITEKLKLPPPPSLKLPLSGTIHEFKRPDYLEIQFEWYDIEAAKSYRFYVSNANSLFLSDRPLKEIKNNTIIVHIPTTTKAKYLWAVSAIDASNNEGPKSPIWNFTVQKSMASATADKEPPVLKITDVEPYIPFLNIKGQTEINATVTINGEPVDVNSEGKFDYFYRLRQAGKNEIIIVAEDQAGNKTEKMIERTIN